MKKCTKCKIEKTEAEFSLHRRGKDGLQERCKVCASAMTKAWYEANRESVMACNALNRLKAKQFVVDYLQTHPCIDCGEGDPIVLDFDHVRGEKKYNLGRIASQTYSRQTLENEIAKCEVRCANCHRRKTAKEQNWIKLTMIRTQAG